MTTRYATPGQVFVEPLVDLLPVWRALLREAEAELRTLPESASSSRAPLEAEIRSLEQSIRDLEARERLPRATR